jgi:hypothetical protein
VQKFKLACWNIFLVLLPIIVFTPVFLNVQWTNPQSTPGVIVFFISPLFGIFNPVVKSAQPLFLKVLLAMVTIVIWGFSLVYYAFWLVMIIWKDGL